jgi:hypothetical protein
LNSHPTSVAVANPALLKRNLRLSILNVPQIFKSS